MRTCTQIMEDRVFELEVQNHADAVIIQCRGRIVHGEGADRLRQVGRAQSKPRLVLELSGVETIDAGGLGVLVELGNWARDGNRAFELLNPSAPVREVLETTGLQSVLTVSARAHSRDAAA